MAEGVLGSIAASRRADLATRFAGVDIGQLRARARPTGRSLRDVLARPGSRFILEIKKASPSRGEIAPKADVATVAKSYAPVADALSVLTETRHFGGSLRDLELARRHFGGPILAKDFFLDPRQVVEARIAGADAILVMLSLVDDRLARELIGEARRFGMDALVEVHDEAEMRRANALEAPIIGINNRNLADLSIDLRTTERLARLAAADIVVSESGIATRSDVERLAAHADAFLVGTALMRSPNPPQAAREMVFGRVKLCGLRRRADVEAASAASFAGFVFVPGTPRHVTAECAAPLAGLARGSGVLPVGVFRDAPLGTVADLAHLLNLHAVQLHGGEDDGYVRRLRRELGGDCEIWTAVEVASGPIGFRGGDRTLFDSGPGGTGRRFDWNRIRGHARLERGIVAGGIGPGNVGEASGLRAFAIDVGSATDVEPGVKSPEKIATLFQELRAPCRRALSKCA